MIEGKPLSSILEVYEDRRILVTGGVGCIGSNLVKALIEAKPEKITVIDNLSSSYLWNLPVDPSITFVKASILEDEALKRCFSDKPNIVFHLAAHFANQNSVEHPETDLMVNGLGTLKVLQYSYLTNVERFFFASSGCSVYGSQAPLPLREDFVSIHLDTPYQITKLLGELYCNYFYNYYRLPVTIGRFFNVYGPGEIPGKYRNVIPKFFWWAMHEKPLPITGTGEETRDFTYVWDIIDGVLRMGGLSKAVGEAINLASETETKVIDLAKLINRITGNNKGVIYQSRREWDKIVRRRASIDKAKKILGYNPKTDIQTGLKETFVWFKENWRDIERSIEF